MRPSATSRSRQKPPAAPGTGGISDANAGSDPRLTLLIVFVVAVASRIPAVGTWWTLDDWGQLARAAGLLDGADHWTARMFSQHLWWTLTWPVLHANALHHALVRITLHALASVAVVRIARAVPLSEIAQLVSGCLFAALPVSCTPTYWASGIQELLGVTCALWACERWNSPGRYALYGSGILGALSIVSKECALALPLAFGAMMTFRPTLQGNHRRERWAVIAGLTVLAGTEIILVLKHFATGSTDPYATGGPLVVVGNLGKFGWWMLNVGSTFTGQVTWKLAGVGLGVLAAWVAIGIAAWIRGNRVPLFAFCCWLASVAPALALVNQARPYMGYLGVAAAAIALGSLLPARGTVRPLARLALPLAAAAWGCATMWSWVGKTGADGSPIDPVVAGVRASRSAAEDLRVALAGVSYTPAMPLVIYQPSPARPPAEATSGVTTTVLATPRHHALGGASGAALVAGSSRPAYWTTSLESVPADAIVLCEKPSGFEAWGNARDALLYAAEIAIATGNYPQAAACLRRALAINAQATLDVPAADKIHIPDAMLAEARRRFDTWLIEAAIEKRVTGDEYLAFSGFPRLR